MEEGGKRENGEKGVTVRRPFSVASLIAIARKVGEGEGGSQNLTKGGGGRKALALCVYYSSTARESRKGLWVLGGGREKRRKVLILFLIIQFGG